MKNFSQVEEINVPGYSAGFAIFSGVLAVLTIGLLLDLLGMAIGLSLFSPAKKVLYSLSIGAIVWGFISTIASTYVGGWIAGYFNSQKEKENGILNGFIVSSLSTFIFLLLTFSTLGIVVSSSLKGLQYALSATKGSVEAVFSTAKEVSDFSPRLSEKTRKMLPNLKPITNKIKQKAEALLPEDEPSAEKIKTELESLIASYLKAIESSNDEKTKEELVSFLAERTGKSSEEINEKIEEWRNDYIEAKEKVYQNLTQVSKDTAKAVSQFSLLNFFILVSGIISGIMGGCHGTRNSRRAY